MTGSEAAAVLAELKEFRAEVRGELKALTKANEDGEKTHDDFEGRLRSLERVRWALVGIALAVGGTGGAVLTRALGA